MSIAEICWMFLYFILNKEEAYELVKKVTDNVSLNNHTCLNVERCQRWNQQRKKKRTRSKPLVIYHATSQYYYWERKQVWKLNQKENKTYHEEVPTMVIIFPLPLLDPHHGARRDWLLWWGSVMREGGPASVGMVWPGVSLLTDCKLQYRSVHVVQIRTCTDFSLFILCTLCALCLWSSNYPRQEGLWLRALLCILWFIQPAKASLWVQDDCTLVTSLLV